ncbi:BICD family-like cargo adapter 1 isoform X2 [Pseudorca crassidens]|uniref:BICD family-like cargo adapter 1 isoform X2 n=1 Tax=Pseudorca crassidens TaxID=82174 RepID=UPI00352D8883
MVSLPGAEPHRECLDRKGGQRATSSACPTLLTRVPVTRPPSQSGALEGLRAKARAEKPSGAPHPGKPQTTTASSVTLPQSPESQVAGALGDTQTEPSLDQVLRERDEAIAKKRAVEAELDIFKAKLRAVEAQLLEVLEEKLRLKQEDDMQWMVRQQVESQLQRESRGALGAPMDPGTARTPWVRFPLRWWGRWR